MTVLQRAVVGIAALLIALRMFAPMHVQRHDRNEGWHEVVATAPTLLQVVGIAAIAVALCVMFPSPAPGIRQRAVIALEIILGILVFAVILNTG